MDGIFDGQVRLESNDDIKLPPGYNQAVLLKRRLNEIADNEPQPQDRIDCKYTLDNLPIKKAVFIDSTWHQCKSIFKDPRINGIRTVVLQNRLSQFWRHQRGSPRWFLATIEGNVKFIHENVANEKRNKSQTYLNFLNSNSSISAGSAYKRLGIGSIVSSTGTT